MSDEIKEMPIGKILKLPEEDNDQWPVYKEHSLFNSAVREAEFSAQVPYEMAVHMALAALAVACQGHVLVERPKTPNTRYPVSLNLLCIAPSGSRKTTLEKVFFSSVRKVESQLLEEFQKEHLSWQDKLELWSQKQKSLKKMLDSAMRKMEPTHDIEQRIEENNENRPQEPKKVSFLFSDVSQPALLKSLSEGLSMGAIISSEGDIVLNGMAFQNNSYLNDLWSGAPISTTRATTGSHYIDNGRLTISLQVQQSSIETFMKNRGKKAQDSGLLARFLTIMPKPDFGNRFYTPVENTRHIDAFNERIEELLKYSVNFLKKQRADYTVLRFSADAEQVWIELYNAAESELADGMRLSNAREFGSKIMENVSRIAALIHMCEGNEGDIDSDTVLFACNLCLFYAELYKNEFIPIPEYVNMAQKMYDKLKAQADKTKSQSVLTTNRTKMTHMGITRNKENLDKVIEILIKWDVLEQNYNGYNFWKDGNPKNRIGSNSQPTSLPPLLDVYKQIERSKWRQN